MTANKVKKCSDKPGMDKSDNKMEDSLEAVEVTVDGDTVFTIRLRFRFCCMKMWSHFCYVGP